MRISGLQVVARQRSQRRSAANALLTDADEWQENEDGKSPSMADVDSDYGRSPASSSNQFVKHKLSLNGKVLFDAAKNAGKAVKATEVTPGRRTEILD